MSARSIVRAHEREQRRAERRRRAGSVGRKVVLGTAGILGAGAIAAGSAEAADFPVSNLSDAGAGSLRDALVGANAAAGADTVSFAAGLSGRIELATTLPITDSVSVNGPGAGVITVDGNQNDTVFTVGNLAAPDQPVTISGLKVVGGDGVNGGGITSFPNGGNAAELTVADALISGNHATGDGGGIYTDEGSLTVRNSTISHNDVGDGTGTDYGGGIHVRDTDGDQPVEVLITDSRFSRNVAFGDGGAAYFRNVDNDTVIQRTTVDGNTSGEDGGGMVFSNGDGTSNTVLIDSSTFSNNTAEDGAGAIWLLDVSEANVITDSTFTGNFAGTYGGGIYDDTDVPTTIRNTTVTGNEAVDLGGGVYANNGPKVVTISSSIISGNVAGTGNDIMNNSGTGAVRHRQQPVRHIRRTDRCRGSE